MSSTCAELHRKSHAVRFTEAGAPPIGIAWSLPFKGTRVTPGLESNEGVGRERFWGVDELGDFMRSYNEDLKREFHEIQ